MHNVLSTLLGSENTVVDKTGKILGIYSIHKELQNQIPITPDQFNMASSIICHPGDYARSQSMGPHYASQVWSITWQNDSWNKLPKEYSPIFYWLISDKFFPFVIWILYT